MKLVIAEKPSVGRSIAEVIGATNKKNGYIEGGGYIVSWCRGHMAKLEEDNSKWDLNHLPVVPTEKIVVKEETKDQFQIVKSLMERSDVTSLICATDAGREGEAIFRYVYHAANCEKPFERLWISSMTDTAIKDGFDHLQDGSNFDNLYRAAVARDKADSLVGISGTRLFSVLYNQYKPPLSVGRVQTPTLSMLVERELNIKAFVKEKTFKVHIKGNVKGNAFEAVTDNISLDTEAESIKNICENETATIISVKGEEKCKNSPRLYDLTSLQRDCNRMFGYTAQQTLDIVQELYESKLCTYPRTDSKFLSDDMEETAKEVIEAVFASAPFIPDMTFNPYIEKVLNSKKVSDHHAIIPTDEVRKLDWSSLTEEKFNVLGMVSTRLLAAIASPYQYFTTNVIVDCQEHQFKASGKVETDSGFKEFERAFSQYRMVEKEEEENDRTLPVVTEGDTFVVSETCISEHWTQPPKHFTEDSILSAMENAGADEITEEVERKGLGTTATRASIIENLISKGYIEREKKNLLPTERAYQLMQIVPEELKSPTMTAEMENTLALVAKGQANADKFFEEMIEYTTRIVSSNREKKIENNPFGTAGTSNELGNCPNCNKIVRPGKYGAWCTNKCGMIISKVYGHKLTDKQVTDLLNEKKVTYKNGQYTNIVLSEIEPFSYEKDGKEIKGFQWKTESKKN